MPETAKTLAQPVSQMALYAFMTDEGVADNNTRLADEEYGLVKGICLALASTCGVLADERIKAANVAHEEVLNGRSERPMVVGDTILAPGARRVHGGIASPGVRPR